MDQSLAVDLVSGGGTVALAVVVYFAVRDLKPELRQIAAGISELLAIARGARDETRE